MPTTVMDTTEWAVTEFSGVQLGDVRRTKRLVKVASALAEGAHGTLPGTFPEWSELKAAYRLFGTDEVTYEAIVAPHWERTRSACRQPGEYLLIEDTTQMDYSWHAAAEQFGVIGDGGGRGFFVHSTMALRVQRWNARQEPETVVVGLFGQYCWHRQPSAARKSEKKGVRLERARESQRWAAVFNDSGGPGPRSRWTYIADRESDIYEVFGRCQEHGVDFIIRANQPRALDKEDRSVFEAVAQRPVLGHFSVDLRARPSQAARKAVMELRSTTVTLRAPWRPGGANKPLKVSVVEAREVDTPEGVRPIHWVLLTNWPCVTFQEAMRVVKAYTRRWLIEEYHKALKSGLHVEESQLSHPVRIQALFGIMAVAGLRLLNTKLLAVTCPHKAVDQQELGADALAILESAWGRPAGGWTYSSVLIAIARLGGFLARKGDGNPGWITIWRGWQKLMLMVQGFSFATGEKCG